MDLGHLFDFICFFYPLVRALPARDGIVVGPAYVVVDVHIGCISYGLFYHVRDSKLLDGGVRLWNQALP